MAEDTKRKIKICSQDGCNKPVLARGLCSTHYARLRISENREKYNKRMREYLKKWRKDRENIEKRRARGERFRLSHLSQMADKERIRRGRARGGKGTFKIKDLKRLFNRFNGLCAYCGINKTDTIDHVTPIKKGGSNFIGNILPACFSCNSSKQDKLLIEWRASK